VIGAGEFVYDIINLFKGRDQLWAFKNYFRKDHPIIELAEAVYGN
jgi:hypothetical protein